MQYLYFMKLGVKFLVVALSINIIYGCSSSNTINTTSNSAPPPSVQETLTSKRIEAMNERLTSTSSSHQDRSYRIGAGDVLDVQIYKVEKLSRSYKVNSSGKIQVPFIGSVNVKGLTAEQVGKKLTKMLNASVLKNPQIDVTVKEYRSQQITILGAVAKPGIYKIEQGVTVYEVLSMAGGFKKDVGKRLYIKTAKKTKMVNVDDMFSSTSTKALQLQQSLNQMILHNGTSIMVEKAGIVYIDGAVKSPGKYQITGDMTVSQLIAESGDTANTASKSNVQILRVISEGNVKVIKVNLDRIHKRLDKDIVLQNSDIVTVGKSPFKMAFHGFFDYALRLVFLVR